MRPERHIGYMWILKPRKGVWHYYEPAGPRVGLCGTTIGDSADAVEQESKPTGFDGLLCNHCWFRREVQQAVSAIPDAAAREWLEVLDFRKISEPDRERLYFELGEDRAESLLVIHSLAESSELDLEVDLPLVLAAQPCTSVAELVAIPLAVRAPAAPMAPEATEEEPPESLQPTEPRMKVNYSRRPTAGNKTGGIGGLLRRITERA